MPEQTTAQMVRELLVAQYGREKADELMAQPVIITQQKPKEDEMKDNDMRDYQPPELFPQKKEEDSLAMVKAHLEAEYGVERATKRLKEMTGLQILELANKLRKGGVIKDNESDDMSTYEPPALFPERR